MRIRGVHPSYRQQWESASSWDGPRMGRWLDMGSNPSSRPQQLSDPGEAPVTGLRFACLQTRMILMAWPPVTAREVPSASESPRGARCPAAGLRSLSEDDEVGALDASQPRGATQTHPLSEAGSQLLPPPGSPPGFGSPLPARLHRTVHAVDWKVLQGRPCLTLC